MPPTDALVDTAARAFVASGARAPRGLAGTFSRKVYDRTTYLRRAAGRAEGERVRERLGHPGRDFGERLASVLLDDPPRWAVLAGLSRGDMRRATRYDAFTNALVRGQMSDAAFRRRIGSWRPIAGEKFLADPAAVRVLIAARKAGDDETFLCSSGRSR